MIEKLNPVDQQQHDALLVAMTIETPGWKIIEQNMIDMGREFTTDLLEAHTLEEMQRLQAQIKSINSLLGIILNHYKVASAAKERSKDR